jgi:acetyl-CoA carboxylase biotin carboxyl carrier protein
VVRLRGYLFGVLKNGNVMAEEIKAHITGTVWKIEVEVGEEVEEDDDFIILESMKMEMPVTAEFDCVVKEIHVSEGDAVEEDEVLLTVEEL